MTIELTEHIEYALELYANFVIRSENPEDIPIAFYNHSPEFYDTLTELMNKPKFVQGREKKTIYLILLRNALTQVNKLQLPKQLSYIKTSLEASLAAAPGIILRHAYLSKDQITEEILPNQIN